MQQFSRNRDAKHCKQKVYGLHFYKQTLAWRQASEESACFLLSFFCDDLNLQAYLFFILIGHHDSSK